MQRLISLSKFLLVFLLFFLFLVSFSKVSYASVDEVIDYSNTDSPTSSLTFSDVENVQGDLEKFNSAKLLGNSLDVNVQFDGDIDSSQASSIAKSCEAYMTLAYSDTAVFSWQGGVSGNYLYVPTKITYLGKSIGIGKLAEACAFQIPNTEYARRMNEGYTLATFDNLSNYFSATHYITLSGFSNVAQADRVINIQYTKVTPVYRLYNMISSEHLFTTDKSEYDGWVKKCQNNKDFWIGEGVAWLSPADTSSTKKVHRLYNAGLGKQGKTSHYYTADETEIKNLTKKHGWKDEGDTKSFQSGGSGSSKSAIYTCYNEALKSAHHYTASKDEWNGLSKHGWDLEKTKNGSAGFFSCIYPTTWSYSGSYHITSVLLLVNEQRTKAKANPLILDQKLVKVAKAKTDDMVKNKYFSHYSPVYGSPFEMMKTFGVSYGAAGENIAAGQDSAASVMKAWMNSEGHKENILSTNYTKLGVGYTVGGSYGIYWAQEFTDGYY